MSTMSMRFVLLLLGALSVSARRGLMEADSTRNLELGGWGGMSMKMGKSWGMDAGDDKPAAMGTTSPTPPPTPAPPTPAPPTPVSPTPVPATLAPTFPITDATAQLVQDSFIPGGTQDTLAPVLNASFLGEIFEFSGELKVVDEGIVSLAAIFPLVGIVTCDQPNKAIQVDFNTPVGLSQIGFLFPAGATLVINANAFGSCLLGPESFPEGVNNGFHNFTQTFPQFAHAGAGDAFLVIGDVVVYDDYTAIIHGKTGTFFNMFSEGKLSIKKVGAVPTRLLEEAELDKFHNDEGELEDYAQRRGLFIDGYFARLNLDNAIVNAFVSFVEDGGLDDLQASWDPSGIVMNADINVEFLATYDLFAGIFPGPTESYRADEQNFPSFEASLIPDFLVLFPILGGYGLPGLVMDFLSQSPLFIEFDEGFVGTQLGYLTRLRYSTGRKRFNLAATGAWDALTVGSVVTESSPGRFTSSNFRVDLEPPPDIPMLPNDFNIYAGITAQIEIYGSLFSGNFGVDVGVQLTSETAPNGNFPPLVSDDIEVVFDGGCDLCPDTRVDVSARAGDLILEVNLGFYIDTDLVGPSSASALGDLQSMSINPVENPTAFVARATYCLNPQYGAGFGDTLSCADRCCDGASGGTCSFIGETEGVCALP